MLCLVGALLLGSEFWTKNGVALTLFILMVQFALFGVVMIPAAYMSAFFARAWFHESRFITIERAIWILILTVEANLIGWIVIPWFCLTL